MCALLFNGRAHGETSLFHEPALALEEGANLLEGQRCLEWRPTPPTDAL
jgi:hypothetical protein